MMRRTLNVVALICATSALGVSAGYAEEQAPAEEHPPPTHKDSVHKNETDGKNGYGDAKVEVKLASGPSTGVKDGSGCKPPINC